MDINFLKELVPVYTTLKTEAASLSNMSVPVCKTTHHHIPEDYILSNQCGENLKSHAVNLMFNNNDQDFVYFTNKSTLTCNISVTYLRH